MIDRRLKQLVSSVAALLLVMMVSGCVDGDPDDVVPTKSDGAFELEMADEEDCVAAGYQVLIDFFAENDIEVTNEEVNGEYPYCKIQMIWAVSEKGNEKKATLYFDLVDYGTVAEAQEAIANPEKMLLTGLEYRDNRDGQVESAPDPWEGGFIWNTYDSVVLGDTEVAVRVANIVVYLDFYYPIPRSSSCKVQGCVVLPSELLSWIQDTYLPAVEQNVNDLIGR